LKVKANYTDGQTAEVCNIDVDLKQDGIILPSGDKWRYCDIELLDADKSNGQLFYKNNKIEGPGLTLIFSGGMTDPARDFLGRISKRLTGDSSWHFVRWQVFTGAAIVGLMVIFYILYPYANRALVTVIPDRWAVRAGDLVLDHLYTEYSANVCRSAEGDKALNKLVQGLQVMDLPYDLRVQVVDHHQVNALTAPGGRIVILNGLLQEAESVSEVAGVLAHEAGHVYYKHPMQGVVNILGFSIVGSFFGGDAASIAVVALSMSYGRDMERQADKKALETLLENDISASGILGFFERLNKKKKNNVAAELEKLLSTHPLSEERIKYISDHIEQHEGVKKFTPYLTDHEWQALKNMCKKTNEL